MNDHLATRAPLTTQTSRRRMLQLMAGAGVALAAPTLLTSCSSKSGGASADANKKVVVAQFGGALGDALRKHVFDPFTKETGIEVVTSGPPTTAKVKAMVDSGNVEWDMFGGSLDQILVLGEKYFEPYPEAALAVDGLDDEFKHSHAMGYYVIGSNMAWNTEMITTPMTSWADFWDLEKFPGKRTMPGTEAGVKPQLEFALLADGVPIESLYPMDLDRAFKAFQRLKPAIPQWWASGAQPGQMLTSKQVSAAAMWIGRIDSLRKSGAPIGFTFNQGLLETGMWLVPKGAPNAAAAFKLASYTTRAEVQARIWGSYLQGPTNSKAFASMDPAWAKQLPTHPDNAKVQFYQQAKWWADNQKEVLARFEKFKI